MADSVNVVRETERKYDVDDGARLTDPAALLDLDAGAGAEQLQLAAVYFDTADLRLLRNRVTLRRRAGGPDEGWHLKLPAGTDSRDEHRLPLGTSGPTEVPRQLASLVRVHSRGADLAPVAELDTSRRRWMLSDTHGRELVELVEDEVRAHTMGAETTTIAWREVEVELAEYGRPDLLDRIEKKLAKAGVHRSTSNSKLGRALEHRLRSATPIPSATVEKLKKGSAGAVVLAYLHIQADQIRAQDPLVRQDVPDALHQLRIAARRMRSALQAYGKVIDRDSTRGLTDELKWLGGELAQARDSEVTDQRLATVINELPAELVMGPVAAHVTRSLARRRADGQATAITALDSDRYLALHDAIDALLADPPLTKKATRPARRELPRHLGRAWRRLNKRMTAANQLEPGPERDVELHETRKAGKRLRYAAEIAEPALGKPAKRLKKRAKTLHKQLGDHQDAVVAQAVIRDLAAQAHLEGGNGFTYGVLHGIEDTRAAEAERELPYTWKRLTKSKNTKWLER